MREKINLADVIVLAFFVMAVVFAAAIVSEASEEKSYYINTDWVGMGEVYR